MDYYYSLGRGDRRKRIELENVVEIADIGPADNGSRKKVCIVAWKNCPPRLDIRKWDQDGEAFNGISLKDNELVDVINAIEKYRQENIEYREFPHLPSEYEDGPPCDVCPNECCPQMLCPYGFF